MLNDIIMLQEIGLYNDEMSVLSNINSDLCGYGISNMNTELRLVSGRPNGGIGIQWRTSLDKSCAVVKYDNESRILGLEVPDNSGCRLYSEMSISNMSILTTMMNIWIITQTV